MLKSTFFTVALVLAGALPLPAQQFFIGLKAGLNYSDRTYDVPAESTSRAGVIGGVSFTYGLTNIVGTRLEILYSAKGDKLTHFHDGVREESTLSAHYIDLPLVLVARTSPVLGMRLNVFAGPVLSLHAGSSVEGNSQHTEHRFEQSPIDVGLTIGGGTAFLVGSELFGVDARYTFGLANSVDNTNGETAPDIRTNTFSLMAAYFFRF